MKQFLLNPLTWLLLMLLTMIIFFLVLLVDIDYANDIPVERPLKQGSHYNLYNRLRQIDVSNLKETFPYDNYLDSANIYDVNELKKDLSEMDSLNKDIYANQEVMSIALTEKLMSRLQSSFVKYNPDSLILMMQWAEKFSAWAEMDEKNSMLFAAVYDYWFNFISNTLAEYYERSYSIKYNYKFRYISDRLKEKQFTTPVRGTWSEKVVTQLVRKNWSYLFNKLWHSTTILYKCIVLLLILMLIFPYFYIIGKGIKNRRK
jgi:hypothetical protein